MSEVNISIETIQPNVVINIEGFSQGDELPPVTEQDNGKVMTVVEGEWKAAEPTGGGSVGGGAVDSVNGKTGHVKLTAEDVGAQPKGDYALKSDLPTVPTKVSAFENDAGYLTKHQDISGKLDASQLPEAINDALEQAKVSGEFDGADGVSPTVAVALITGGHRITITDANGMETVDVLDGSNGSDGRGIKAIVRTSGSGTPGTTDTYTITYTDDTTSTFGVYNGKDGSPGAAGTSVAVESVSESPADGGANVVTFSDGKTITIRNGSKGSAGSPGSKGDPGYTPVRGVDYWTEADIATIKGYVDDAILGGSW